MAKCSFAVKWDAFEQSINWMLDALSGCQQLRHGLSGQCLCEVARSLANPLDICLWQVQYLMRGINGEKLGLKCLNVGKILTIWSLCRVKCKLYLRSKTQGERDYEKCHWRNPFWYVVCKMMTIFINRIWCVKVSKLPFVGNWSKRRQTESSTTKTSTNRNTDIPKCRQTKTSTDQNVDKLNQTKTSKYQNIDRPKTLTYKTSTDRNVDYTI